MKDKKTGVKKIITVLALGEFGKTAYSVVLINFLMYFFVPPAKSSLPLLLPRAAFWFALIRGGSIIVDAVTDPLIAYLSDRSGAKHGRRVSFMQMSALPAGFFCFAVFFAPFGEGSGLNVLWLAVTLFLYYLFATMYNVPYSALIPEILVNSKDRRNFYTIAAIIQVFGALLAAFIPSLRKLFFEVFHMELLASWRFTFILIGSIGGILAMIPALIIREGEHAEKKVYSRPVLQSLKEIFRIRQMFFLFISNMISGVGGSFFKTALMYYITMLLGLDGSFFTVILIVSLAFTLLSYPVVNKLAPIVGRKALIQTGNILWALAYLITFLAVPILKIVPPRVLGIAIGIIVAFPTAAGDVLFPAAYADICQYDSIVTGHSRAGIILAGKTFIQKLQVALVNLCIPLVITFRSMDGKATFTGVLGSAVIAFLTSLLAIFVLARFYNESEIIRTLQSAEQREGEED